MTEPKLPAAYPDYPTRGKPQAKSNGGQASHDHVLLGMHFIQSNIGKALRKRTEAAFDPAVLAPVRAFGITLPI